jgi:hypothetical protein
MSPTILSTLEPTLQPTKEPTLKPILGAAPKQTVRHTQESILKQNDKIVSDLKKNVWCSWCWQAFAFAYDLLPKNIMLIPAPRGLTGQADDLDSGFSNQIPVTSAPALPHVDENRTTFISSNVTANRVKIVKWRLTENTHLVETRQEFRNLNMQHVFQSSEFNAR